MMNVRLNRAITATMAICALAACSQNTSMQAVPAGAPAFPARARFAAVSRAADNVTHLFAAQYDFVSIFDGNGNQTGEIDVPQAGGLAVDANANLWVTDSTKYRVWIYPPPYTQPSTSIDDTNGHPNAVAVDTHPGPMKGYFAIFSRPTTGGYNSMSLYSAGSTRPCKTLGGRFVAAGINGTFDGGGNLIVFGDGKPVAIWRGGCSAPAIEKLYSQSGTLAGPAAAAAGPNGTIAILDQEYSNGFTGTLFGFDKPVKAHFGQPVVSMSLAANQLPQGFAFTQNGNDVWISNYDGNVMEYAYPSGSVLVTLPQAFWSGAIAVAPPFVP
ncbi:MAG TPA: hypothetical protein VKT72_09290 [Candidatus Baltobacteraceae bacterium]|nr:hypothetical protein [Candidatus Baltobacteraceae bacterium]